jgi:hypothetical protein
MTSRSPRTKLLGFIGLVSVAAILGLGVAAITIPSVRHDGPLQPNATTNLEFSLAPGQTASWGVDVPTNPTASEIVFRSAELVEPAGFSILGVAMNRPNTGSIVSVYGYPPAGFPVVPVEGSTLPAGGSVMVVVGVQLADGVTEGTIRGVRVRYATGGQEYEVMLEYRLRITLKTG